MGMIAMLSLMPISLILSLNDVMYKAEYHTPPLILVGYWKFRWNPVHSSPFQSPLELLTYIHLDSSGFWSIPVIVGAFLTYDRVCDASVCDITCHIQYGYHLEAFFEHYSLVVTWVCDMPCYIQYR